ncbi:MAG: dTDP-4-amino-4,6-dideoxygalactose transaminase, partial [Fibrobacter sp.]|nr:dTDP-4-amino-4,6-dideoxygalactose transaminase [Fibrobacter sp.]
MYHILLPDLDTRTRLIRHLKEQQITAVFHYIPLHSSPMGKKLATRHFDLPVTDNVADRLLRLPCYFEMTPEDVEKIADQISIFSQCDHHTR